MIILWAEQRKHIVDVDQIEDMNWKHALKVGLIQCFALIPGTSRSGATIIGGLLFGLSRKAATEFSFFLAIPIMFAATFYDVLKHRESLLKFFLITKIIYFQFWLPELGFIGREVSAALMEQPIGPVDVPKF